MWEDVYRAACAGVRTAVREDISTGGATGEIVAPGNSFNNFKQRLTDADVEAVLSAMRSCSDIATLSIPYNCVGDRGGVLLGNALAHHHTGSLLTLDARHNAFGAEAGMALARGIEVNDSLCHLLLAGNPLTGMWGPALGAALRHNACLSTLDLYNTELDLQALVHLCRALEGNRRLASLNVGRPLLRGPDEVSSVVNHLSVALKRNSTLEDLTLSYFGITDDDLQTLVLALCGSAVVSLNIKGNKLSEDAGQLLARLLDRRHDFRTLDVSCNRLRDRGAEGLAKGVAQHPQLECFSVESCTIGEPGLVDLISALRSCAALRRLTLWGNEMTPAVAQALSRSFGDLRGFEHVDVGVEQRDGQWAAYRA